MVFLRMVIQRTRGRRMKVPKCAITTETDRSALHLNADMCPDVSRQERDSTQLSECQTERELGWPVAPWTRYRTVPVRRRWRPTDSGEARHGFGRKRRRRGCSRYCEHTGTTGNNSASIICPDFGQIWMRGGGASNVWYVLPYDVGGHNWGKDIRQPS